MSSVLISVSELQALLAMPGDRLMVLDLTFDLAHPAAGEQVYMAGHVPGAIYLHLDRDLSAPKTGRNGRHPLPGRDEFAARLAHVGARNGMRFVVYDGSGGMYAARAWWMLRWLGEADVSVLDGGMSAWRTAGGPLEAGPMSPRAAGDLRPAAQGMASVDFAELLAAHAGGPWTVVDARAPDRFRGENETLDPVGGRIPGALNRFFRDNLGPEGLFKPAAQLRAEWSAVLAGRDPARAVHQCGSGVTACHNLLALEIAGLQGGALYPGSWSEWCAQPGAPIATGAAG